MLVIINKGGKLSQKALFVIRNMRLTLKEDIFFVFQKDSEKFSETWSGNKVQLATSLRGILTYYLLIFFKSPGDLHHGILRRLFKKTGDQKLVTEGFLSSLSLVLEHYFTSPARTNTLIKVLRDLGSPKTFLIDEFSSVNIVNLKMLKQMGQIIYVSQDVACNRFGFNNNLISKNLVNNLERDAVAQADLVIACSERDKLKYKEMNAKKVIYYPNIYPILDFKPLKKDTNPSICIVLKSHWGSMAYLTLEEILKALSFLNGEIKVYLIGIKPKVIPKNVNLEYFESIPDKISFLELLSKAWIGINIGFHAGGSNERKYDYSMANCVVISDMLGAKGDLLPYEYTYLDIHDLAAKIEQLLRFGREELLKMGLENHKQALFLAEDQKENLLRTISDLMRS